MISIGIIGHTCSGKSTAAKQVSKILDIPIASFGKYLLDYSTKNGLPTEKSALQDLGNQFIKKDVVKFLKDVISQISDNPDIVLFEGIRHLAILKSIKEISTVSYFFYLDVPVSIRYERYCKRENLSNFAFDQFLKLEEHVVESEIDSLEKECDQVVRFEGQSASTVSEALKERITNILTQ